MKTWVDKVENFLAFWKGQDNPLLFFHGNVQNFYIAGQQQYTWSALLVSHGKNG
jgi:hypothetical protein